jgi:hypothetical protein
MAARQKAEARMVVRTIADMSGTMQRVTVNLAESPLAWLKARKLVTHRQFEAGEQLRRDWEQAGLGPRVTMRWDAAMAPSGNRRGGAAPPDPSLAGLAARDRLQGALDMAGPGLCDILWRVVCACEGISAAETALGWPQRAGKLVLGFALDRVADFYRIR